MPIQFCCTQCGQPIEVDAEHAGKSAVCPYCRHMIAVPSDSTYQAGSAVPARPLGGVVDEVSQPEAPYEAQRPHTRPAIPPPRLRAGHTFGSFALFCTILGVALLIAALIGSAQLILPKLATLPTSNPNPAEMEQIVKSIKPPAWIPALEVGALVFGLTGLALGIVSLTQAGANWRGLTAVIICGLFLLCVCGAFAMAVMMGLGAPTGG